MFFSSPPTARTGGISSPSNTGTGTYPRERRSCRTRPAACAHHGVVAAPQDVAIVNQEEIRQMPCEPVDRFLIVDGDGLLAEVAAGHDQRHEAAVRKQEMMERRVGQKHAATRAQAGGHVVHYRNVRLLRHAAQSGRSGPSKSARETSSALQKPSTALKSGAMTAKGLPTRRLRSRKVATAAIVGCVRRRGEIPRGPSPPRCARLRSRRGGLAEWDRTLHAWPPESHSSGPRAAVPAGVGLGVETAIERDRRIRVWQAAHMAKDRHGSARAVVRDVAHDGETRPAIRAVDEGVAVAAVVGIEHLAQAIGADRDVRRDQRPALPDRRGWRGCETRVVVAGEICTTSAGDSSERRQFRQAGARGKHRPPGAAPPLQWSRPPPYWRWNPARPSSFARR